MIFKNTFKPTIRHLLRDKSYLLVNVLSLAIGLICCLYIFSYVWNELSYDRFHDDADRIYRLELEVFSEDGVNTRYAFYGGSLGDWLDQVPEIERETRFATFSWDMNVDVKGEQFAENGIIAADSSFFDLFSFRLLQGTPLTALANLNSIVISKTTALKYFDTTDVLGETLLISFQRWEALLTITGVVEDIPSNSHFSFDMVASADAYKQLSGYHIRDYPRAYSYILISENATTSDVEKKVNELYRKHAANDASTSRFFAKPMTNIHLHSSAIGELSANSNANYVYLFTLIAFVILGIACVNFTTLATARSVKRAREIGMRKVFGAANRNLMAIFLLEGVLLSFAGLFLAYVVAWFLLPYSNLLEGKSLSFASLAEPFFLLIMTGLTFLTGVVAGLYPALVLSRHKPASLLGKEAIKGSWGARIWKSMVVTQFAISMVLIGSTYIIHQQMYFIFTKDLGFQKEQIITFNNNFGDRKEHFIEQLNQHPNISQTTTSSYIPGAGKTAGLSMVEMEGKTGSMTFNAIIVDPHFFDTYDIDITRGRNFSAELASDSTQAFIINEAAVKMLGWTEPLGKKMHAYGKDGYVIGVVEDVNFTSLHNEIAPMVFLMYDRHHAWISTKIHSAQRLPETLSYIEGIWGKIAPGMPFRYHFLDDQFAALYAFEERALSLFFSFSALAIVIAVLGLFSFAAYSVQQKTREIGIRKVLGATVYDILKLFYTGYAKLLVIATLVALPVSYIWMNSWLQNFSYRTDIGFGAYGIPLILAFVILVFSVSYQVLKGARRNPAETIRME